jgi:aspartate-semialdehyde dehydrogenase
MDVSSTIAIVGATGAVGRECLSILEQRKFQHGAIKLLASSRSAGTSIPYRGKSVTVEELGPRSFDGVKLAFFAAGADTVKAFAPIAVAAGCTVIDKSSAYRADPTVPLVIPEVNPDAVDSPSSTSSLRASVPSSLPRIIAVPNCSTIILLIPLNPIRKAFGIDRLVVSTYQAASGAGAAAMDELESQTRDILAGKAAEPRIFKEPCAFNVFSHDSTMNPTTGLNSEEQKFTTESRKIWNDPTVKVNATCIRVPVMRGHSESVCLTLKTPATESQFRAALEGAPGLKVIDDRANNRFPTPLRVSGGDDVLVGRIRPDETQEVVGSGGGAAYRGWNLWISGDQLRTGAALTAVKIAELLQK